jgi:colanic acid/amylovoran biosynthesis glycosyltransferase
VVLTSVKAEPTGPGRYRLMRKFVEGMQSYARAWDGPVYAFCDPRALDTGNLDPVELAEADLGFQLRHVPFEKRALADELRGHGVVLAGPSHLLQGLAAQCAELGVPCVYNSEYTLRTRLQFVHAERKNPLRQLWGALWELREEARNVKQMRLAAGIQCNGLPCYLKYAPLTPAPLLYFDSRILAPDLATDEELLESNRRRRRGDPLHLVFSGRLIRAKGADHLLQVAHALNERGIPFRMTICGDGALKPLLAKRIEKSGLENQVHLAGVLDFKSELLPLCKRSADLFVCCHRQGDPSCTYLETFACGVPIVGYANEALSTLVGQTEAGATVPVGKPELLAELIGALHAERDRLCIWAYRARDFANKHTMELTFDARVRHLRAIRDGARHGATAATTWEPLPTSTLRHVREA